eukprot:2905539-Amphidinium_carterae.1
MALKTDGNFTKLPPHGKKRKTQSSSVASLYKTQALEAAPTVETYARAWPQNTPPRSCNSNAGLCTAK